MAGPTTDYGYTIFGSDVASTPGYVTESVTAAACDSKGNCSYTFTHAIPAASTGTYAIGVEARRTDVILAGTTSQQSVQYGATNKVVYFSVDGSPVTPRRAVVAEANCNRCHVELSLHGGLRNQVEYCVICHNPSNTDATTRPTATVAAQITMPNQGIDFDLLVHRIHTGVNLPANRDYIVVGHGGAVSDFGQGATPVYFPAMDPTGTPTDTANCSLCHVNASEANLPFGKNAVVDPQGPINPDQPITAACTGCHLAQYTASHALSNTSSLGESCQACHSTGMDYGVDAVHAQY